MPDQDGFPLPEEIYPLYKLIRDGQGFKNRVRPYIDAVRDQISDQIPKLQFLIDAVTPPLTPPPPPPPIPVILNWDETTLTELRDNLESLDETLVNLISHTNRICGVTINYQSQLPTVQALLGTTDALQELEEKIFEGSGGTEEITDATTQFFGSLVSMPEFMTTTEAFIVDLDKKIDFEEDVLVDAEPYASDPTHEQPLPTDTNLYILMVKATIDALITQERQNFNNAITKMTQWSFAEALIDPTSVWRDFFVTYMASDDMAPLIPEPKEGK